MIIPLFSIFEQYISNVLPELGEDHVASTVFDDMIRAACGNKRRIQSRNEFLENLMIHPQNKAVIKSNIEFKTSEYFSKILDQLLEDRQHKWIDLEPMKLYKKLFSDEEYFYSLLKKCDSMEDIKEIRTHIREVCTHIKEIWNDTKANLKSDVLRYDDAIAVTYLYLKIYGTSEYKSIKQVVIDEAQDYYPLQYIIFNLLFPNAKFTILGDINQTIEKQENLYLYERIKNIMNQKNASLITLNKSFRCTTEILDFSLKILEQDLEIERFNRKGDEPEVMVFDSREALIDQICKEVELCQKRGYQSVGLICKTEENAVRLFEEIKDKMEIRMIRNGEVSDLQGVFIIPVYMSKGLEFDADDRNYADEDDRHFLYVGCTRALHRLNLFCEGNRNVSSRAC